MSTTATAAATGITTAARTSAGGRDALRRVETQLRAVVRGHERTAMRRWRHASAELAEADSVSCPTEIARWLRTRPVTQADEVLRAMLLQAQQGDTAALLIVLVCLAPGIRALAHRARVSLDEVVSEVVLRALEYPAQRRRSVAGGLLLDARNRMMRQARRAPLPVEDLDGRPDTHRLGRSSGHPAGPTAAERLLALVNQARRSRLISREDAQLVVDTRLGGEGMAVAAGRLGISRAAGYQRRARAERRLAGPT